MLPAVAMQTSQATQTSCRASQAHQCGKATPRRACRRLQQSVKAISELVCLIWVGWEFMMLHFYP
jgi:hypothetical protein